MKLKRPTPDTNRLRVEPGGQIVSQSLWRIGLRRLLRKKVGMACLAFILVVYLWGSLATWATPYSYSRTDLSAVTRGPSLSHPFGTDQLGRDVLTRVVYGVRTTVIVTIASLVTGGLVLGVGLGLVSGYFGRWVDSLIMRTGEVFLAFPSILLVILIAATVKPRVLGWVHWLEDTTGIDGIARLGVADYLVVFGAVAAFSWVGMARLVRGQVLSLKESNYIDAARALGAPTRRILVTHLLPNIMSPVIVLVSIGMATAVGVEIVLSWLGIGIQPPTPSLGVMIFENGNINTLRTHPHLLLFPVGVVTLLVLAFNLLGDALNDAFNPWAR